MDNRIDIGMLPKNAGHRAARRSLRQNRDRVNCGMFSRGDARFYRSSDELGLNARAGVRRDVRVGRVQRET
jgi:hypothetical protein